MQCAEPECNLYATAPTEHCSLHSPEGKARAAAAALESAAAEKIEEVQLTAAAAELRRLPLPAMGPKQYLVLGATPHENRGERTHYNRNNVYLLGRDKRRPGVNYRRYILADYSGAKKDELRKIANQYANRFDEISFDESAMCSFYDADGSTKHRLTSFYIMLKDNGRFYLSDASQEIEDILPGIGFRTMKVRVKDLGPEALPSIIHLNKKSIILIAIKMAGDVAPLGGTRRRKHRSRGARRRLKF